ncbi:MAG: hypothetical protein JXM69_20170 [Anaerolineae bacterium]|nr:hypothetical protein [Anaerolineae bacterium]
MTTEQNLSVEQSGASGKGTGRIILGLTLLAPAIICCISELAVPTFKTLITSLQETNPLGQEAKFVGLENYSRLFQDEIFTGALGFTMLWLMVRLLVVALIPLLLALIVNQFGRRVRIPLRLLYAIPVVLFGPLLMALAWPLTLQPSFGIFQGQVLLADREQVRQTFLSIDALYVLGLASGIGLVVYLAALRSEAEAAPSRLKALIPLGASWLIGLLATGALTLQSFIWSFALTRGGPANVTTTLGLYQYKMTFQHFRFGFGAAVASLSLMALVLLGIMAGLIIIFAGLKLKTLSPGQGTTLLSGMNKPLAIILLVLILLVSLSLGALSVLPLLWNALTSFKSPAELAQASSLWPTSPTLEAYARLGKMIPLGRALINSTMPLLAALLLLQLPVAYLGALGIGALRPLGRWSELLLLLFSPWLFVAIGPLSLPAFEGMRQAGILDTFIGLAPPILISVPILFILTLFFKGRASTWQAAQAEGQPATGAFFKTLILPSLPLVVLLAFAAFFIGLQETLWPLVVTRGPEQGTITTTLLSLQGQFRSMAPLLAAAVTLFWLPFSLFFGVILAIFQIFYLERLSLS